MVQIVEKTCPVCGKTFSGRLSQKFCSASCKEIDIRNRRKAARAEYYQKNKEKLKAYSRENSNKPKEKIEKVCPVCGETFITTDNKKVYCSPECRYEVEKRSILENRKKPEHNKVCPICGKEFISHHASRIYCSDECYKQATINRERKLSEDPEFRRLHSDRTISYQQRVKELGMTIKEFKEFEKSGADVEAYLAERRKNATRICKHCGKEFISYNKIHSTRCCDECRNKRKSK